MPTAHRTVLGSDLAALLHELLDAHTDTVVLAASPFDELRWEAHLDYLRALHRAGREILAALPSRIPVRFVEDR